MNGVDIGACRDKLKILLGGNAADIALLILNGNALLGDDDVDSEQQHEGADIDVCAVLDGAGDELGEHAVDISRKLIESEDGSNRKSDVKTVEGYISGIALGAASHGEQHEADYDDYEREQDGNKGDRVCNECGADYRGACHGEQSTEINRGNEIIDLDGIYVLCGLLNERAVECDLAQRQHELFSILFLFIIFLHNFFNWTICSPINI